MGIIQIASLTGALTFITMLVTNVVRYTVPMTPAVAPDALYNTEIKNTAPSPGDQSLKTSTVTHKVI